MPSDFTNMNLEVLRRAEMMQGAAVRNIREQFFVEPVPPELTLESLTWERYLQELDAAEANGTQDQFRQSLIKMLQPVIEQILLGGPDAGQTG